MNLDKHKDRCQPCDWFARTQDDPWPHQCPDCGGLRYFCANCLKDHHENGWQSCAVTELMRACRHEACKDRVALEDSE